MKLEIFAVNKEGYEKKILALNERQRWMVDTGFLDEGFDGLTLDLDPKKLEKLGAIQLSIRYMPD